MIKRIIKGSQYSEKYGSHPGTPVLIFGVILGGLAGLANPNDPSFIIGAIIAAGFLVPMWAIGCWERGE